MTAFPPLSSTSTPTPGGPSASLRAALKQASAGLIEREDLLELIILAAVAREHVLVIGPPGTAKSEAARRAARCVNGRYFEYLLGRFTEPSELFGPIDINKLRAGRMETQTHDMLPEAEVAFLDEIFLGSTAILNTLLAVLHERTFRRGHTQVDVPLRVCVAASNELPDDPSLAAFADRFLLHAFVRPVPDHRLEDLLRVTREEPQAATPAAARGSLAELDTISRAADAVDLGGVRGELAAAIRILRDQGITLSDRRIVKLQRLVAAAAALDGRTVADARDLWPLVNAMPTEADQETARRALGEILAASRNRTLSDAALSASGSVAARTEKIVRVGGDLLAGDPLDEDREGWKRRLEALGREIDVLFAADEMPDEVRDLRAGLTAALQGDLDTADAGA